MHMPTCGHSRSSSNASSDNSDNTTNYYFSSQQQQQQQHQQQQQQQQHGQQQSCTSIGILPRWVERVRSWRRRAAQSKQKGTKHAAHSEERAGSPAVEPPSMTPIQRPSFETPRNSNAGNSSELTASLRTAASFESITTSSSLSSRSSGENFATLQNVKCFTATENDSFYIKLETVLELLTEESGSLGACVPMCQMWLPKRGGGSIASSHGSIASGGVMHASEKMRRGRCALHLHFLERAGRVPCGEGVGLPGRVYKSCGVEVVQDVRQAECFPTKKLCDDHGVHCVLGFPLYKKQIPPPPKHLDKRERRRYRPKPDAVLEVYLDAPTINSTNGTTATINAATATADGYIAASSPSVWRQMQARDLAIAGGAPAVITRIESLVSDAELFISPYHPDASSVFVLKQPNQPDSPVYPPKAPTPLLAALANAPPPPPHLAGPDPLSVLKIKAPPTVSPSLPIPIVRPTTQAA